MKKIKLSLKGNGYAILIGDRILSQLGQALKALRMKEDAVVITDHIVARYHLAGVVRSLKKDGFRTKPIVVPAGEHSKSIKMAMKVLQELAAYDVMKNVFIVALGGGVVGDLAGFVAAVYKRGVPYVQVPTTLLAQIDSAIGGKVAIDLPVGKNLVGAFYQPKMVYSDVAFLSTLHRRQIRNGLAEAVKYGVIHDKNLFEFIEKNTSALLRGEKKHLVRLVEACSRIKAYVVMKDERETKGIRTILNFGHTLGHAIEAADGYNRYHHGEAIALGMRMAAEISSRLGLLNSDAAQRLNKVLTSLGLPQTVKGLKWKDILPLMLHDKKFRAGKNRFVLAKRIGQVCVKEGIPLQTIREAVETFV